MKPDAVDYGIVSLKSRYSVTETIDGVKSIGRKSGGAKWGVLYLTDIAQIENALQAIRRSYPFIKEAVNNEPTGWYANLEESQEEGEEAASTGSR